MGWPAAHLFRLSLTSLVTWWVVALSSVTWQIARTSRWCSFTARPSPLLFLQAQQACFQFHGPCWVHADTCETLKGSQAVPSMASLAVGFVDRSALRIGSTRI